MGIFDLFKKKETNDQPENLYAALRKYNAYIVQFIHFQQQGNYAPIAAYEGTDGTLTGFLFVNADEAYTLSVFEVVSRMEQELGSRLAQGSIKSYVVLYHSMFAQNDNHTIAERNEDLKAITIVYNIAGYQAGKIGLTYTFDSDGGITYQGIREFTQEQNTEIFQTPLQQGKNYFAERVEARSEETENAAGLKIAKFNTGTLSNLWGGILGFEYFNNEGGKLLQEYFALTLIQKPIHSHDGLTVTEVDFGDVAFRAVSKNGKALTLIPVVKTGYTIDAENVTLNEWENSADTEATIIARGRDTFGITYFATDYAQNRQAYNANKKVRLKPSAIAYVLDVQKETEKMGDLPLSKNFTAYMPNKELQSWGCFDFIGQLEDFRTIHIMEDKSVQAYILNVRLITHDVPDFFTIDIYVNPRNMRFTELTKGMKLTGMFQLQAELA